MKCVIRTDEEKKHIRIDATIELNKLPGVSKVSVKDIVLVNTRLHGLAKNKQMPYLLLSTKPIEITVKGVIYRIVPMYRGLAVSIAGTVITSLTHKPFPGNKGSGYQVIFSKDYLNNNDKYYIFNHRLTALAWLPNDDYVDKNVVDHIDGDKYNNNASNLRWVNHGENMSAYAHGKLDTFAVVRMEEDGSVSLVKFPSATAVGKYVSTTHSHISTRSVPRISPRTRIIYDIKESCKDKIDLMIVELAAVKNMSSSDIRKLYISTKYNYSLENLITGYVSHHMSMADARAFVDDTACSKYNSYRLTNWFTKRGYKLTRFKKHFNRNNSCDIKNIVTGEEHLNLTREEVMSITKLTLTSVYDRTNRKRGYGLLYNNWLLKLSEDEEYPKIKEVPVRYIYTATHEDGMCDTFRSTRQLSAAIGVARPYIKKMWGMGKIYKKWSVTRSIDT